MIKKQAKVLELRYLGIKGGGGNGCPFISRKKLVVCRFLRFEFGRFAKSVKVGRFEKSAFIGRSTILRNLVG